jgi:hypothetical protein
MKYAYMDFRAILYLSRFVFHSILAWFTYSSGVFL